MHSSSTSVLRLQPLALTLGVLTLMGGCTDAPWEPAESQRNELNALWGPPPAARDSTNALLGNPDAEALGDALFDDAALSGCGTISCASCHPAPAYTTQTAAGTGCNGASTARNPPTLLNVGALQWFMWDGRADRLWSQAALPLLNPVEMASTPAILRARLQEAYAAQWTALFGVAPETVTDDDQLLADFGKVMAAYQSTLMTGESQFDLDVRRFVDLWDQGEGRVQSDPAYLGLFVFVEKGNCISCHKGRMLEDGKYHNVGVEDVSEGRFGREAAIAPLLASPLRGDGRYSDDPQALAARLANLQADFATVETREPKRFQQEFRGGFKTASLRNIAETAPYMHTGAYATLEDVITLYNDGGEDPGLYEGEVNPLTIHKLDLTTEEQHALLELLRSMSAPLR
jgi:cytochrome c peroxidase